MIWLGHGLPATHDGTLSLDISGPAVAAAGASRLCGGGRADPCWKCCVPRRSLAQAYRELGLEAGADVAEVKRAFRKLAREFHPDVCDPADLLPAGKRFAQVRSAYETIITGGSVDGPAPSANFGHNMGGFTRNMATGQGHHKVSDGRLFELWLDVRGDPRVLDNARQEVMSLFFRMRSILDEMGLSLAKEGFIGAVLASTGPGGRAPLDVDTWDHKWIPLMLVNESTGVVTYALSGEQAGHLRAMTRSRLLAPSPNDPPAATTDGAGTADSFTSDDIFVAASDASEAQRARRRYAFTMQALVLPPDAVSWVVSACIGDADVERTTAVGRRFSEMM